MSYWAFRTALRDYHLDRRIYEGKAFIAGKRFEAVADGSSIQILFNNPSNSNVKAKIILIEIVTGGKFYVDVARDVTISASGTAIPVMNLNFGSTNTPSCNVEYGGTYTGGTTTLTSMVPGGTLVRAVGDIASFGESMLIPEGHNKLFTVTNQSGATEDFSIKFLWWEE